MDSNTKDEKNHKKGKVDSANFSAQKEQSHLATEGQSGEQFSRDFCDFITALDALNDIAQQLWDNGMPEKACLTEAQIYESSRKVLGKNHEGTLNAMHNYALGLAKIGRNDEAAKLLNEYFQITGVEKQL